MLPAGGNGARAFQFGGRVIVDSKRRNRRIKRRVGWLGEEAGKERNARRKRLARENCPMALTAEGEMIQLHDSNRRVW